MNRASFIIGLLTSAAVALSGAENSAAKKTVKASAPTQKTAVKAVKTAKKVPAQILLSSCSPHAGDATAAFLKALQTGAKKIVFDRPGTYHLRPVKLRNNLEVVFADGVTLKALPQLSGTRAKITPLPALFNGWKLRNVTFSGRGEAQIHGLPGSAIFNFTDSGNIQLEKLYLTAGKKGISFTRSSGIRLQGLLLDDFQGNGIEFNGGSWFTLSTLVMRNINGDAIAITADSFGRVPNGTADNVEIYNSTGGIVFALPDKIKPFTGKLPPKYRPPVFTIRNSRFFRNSKLDISIPGDLLTGKISISFCQFTNLNHPSLKLDNFSNAPDKVKLEIANCAFTPEQKSIIPPLNVSSTRDLPLGNINIKNSTVKLPVNRKAIEFKLKNNTGSISGELQLASPDGQVKQVNLNPKQE